MGIRHDDGKREPFRFPGLTLKRLLTKIGSVLPTVAAVVANIVSIILIPLTYATLTETKAANELTRAQISEERRVRRDEEKRGQAVGVSVWSDGSRSEDGRHATYMVGNRSDLPVYHVIIYPVPVQGAADPVTARRSGMTNVDVIPPGLYEVDGPLMNAGMSLVLEPAIAFTDAGGNHWLRDADGTLSELDRDPYVEYDLPLPYSANTATPVER